MKIWDIIEEYRLSTVVVVMLIIWFSLLGFWYLKADEITKDPCTICSQQMGEDVVCRTTGLNFKERTYSPDGNISQGTTIDDAFKREVFTINESKWEGLVP